jgi:hypothetical protein
LQELQVLGHHNSNRGTLDSTDLHGSAMPEESQGSYGNDMAMTKSYDEMADAENEMEDEMLAPQ